MSKKDSSASAGISFPGLLALLFIGLKLTGFITWSWWWVLSPLWAIAAVVLVLLVVAALVAALK